MKKKIFFSKKNNKVYSIILLITILLIIYFISFYLSITKKYFIINNYNDNNYYLIPDDKEGEKVSFLDKKSINNSLKPEKEKYFLNNVNELNYTIQLYSDINYKKVEKYLNNLITQKSEIISTDEIFIFEINSQIGIDYFLTYKNFDSKSDALNYCKQLSFIKRCLIIKP